MQVGLVDHSTCGEQLCDVALDWHPAFWKEPCLMRGKGWWNKGLTHLPQLQEPTLSCSNAALQKRVMLAALSTPNDPVLLDLCVVLSLFNLLHAAMRFQSRGAVSGLCVQLHVLRLAVLLQACACI